MHKYFNFTKSENCQKHEHFELEWEINQLSKVQKNHNIFVILLYIFLAALKGLFKYLTTVAGALWVCLIKILNLFKVHYLNVFKNNLMSPEVPKKYLENNLQRIKLKKRVYTFVHFGRPLSKSRAVHLVVSVRFSFYPSVPLSVGPSVRPSFCLLQHK